jgi:hypothetical protein
MTVNVMDYGAVGDGIADDRDAFLAAIAALGGQPGVVHIPSGSFFISDNLSMPSGLILQGSGADSTRILVDIGGAERDVLVASSFDIESDLNVLEAPLEGQRLLKVDHAGSIEAGDWLEIVQDNGSWDSNPAGWAAESVGHIAQVSTVLGDSVMLADPFLIDMDLALNVRARVFTPKQNIGLECFSIERLDDAPGGSNIFFGMSVNCWVRNVHSIKSAGAHIFTTRSAHLEFSHNFCEDAWKFDGVATRGYGVCLTRHSTAILVQDHIFRRLRHAMMVKQGANGNVFAYNYSREGRRSEFISDYTGDISLHGHYPYANLFEGNIVDNIFTDDYWGPSGPKNTFYRNRAKGYGIVMSSPGSNDHAFVGNEVTSNAFLKGLYILTGSNHYENANWDGSSLIPGSSVPLIDESLFYSSAPSFWTSLDWPAVGDNSSKSIPAEQRWLVEAQKVTCEQACAAVDFLSVDSVASNSVMLSWSEVDMATAYQVRGKIIGSSTWQSTAVTDNSIRINGLLSAGSTYEWQVKAICSSSEGPSSLSSFFTTPIFRDTETSNSVITEELLVYPIPAYDMLYIETEANWKILDLQGRALREGTGAVQLDIRDLEAGIYILDAGLEKRQIIIH